MCVCHWSFCFCFFSFSFSLCIYLEQFFFVVNNLCRQQRAIYNMYLPVCMITKQRQIHQKKSKLNYTQRKSEKTTKKSASKQRTSARKKTAHNQQNQELVSRINWPYKYISIIRYSGNVILFYTFVKEFSSTLLLLLLLLFCVCVYVSRVWVVLLLELLLLLICVWFHIVCVDMTAW